VILRQEFVPFKLKSARKDFYRKLRVDHGHDVVLDYFKKREILESEARVRDARLAITVTFSTQIVLKSKRNPGL
jgi:hypothetical protein